VEIVKGDDDNPKLPSGLLAAVLVVNTYHHFEKYQAMWPLGDRRLQLVGSSAKSQIRSGQDPPD
jgi:hypothetical protein